jgi:hypothetical protein
MEYYMMRDNSGTIFPKRDEERDSIFAQFQESRRKCEIAAGNHDRYDTPATKLAKDKALREHKAFLGRKATIVEYASEGVGGFRVSRATKSNRAIIKETEDKLMGTMLGRFCRSESPGRPYTHYPTYLLMESIYREAIEIHEDIQKEQPRGTSRDDSQQPSI